MKFKVRIVKYEEKTMKGKNLKEIIDQLPYNNFYIDPANRIIYCIKEKIPTECSLYQALVVLSSFSKSIQEKVNKIRQLVEEISFEILDIPNLE